MKDFSIHIDTSFWSEKAPIKKGYCYISIKTKKGFFPEKEWTDFAVTMLIEWIANFVDLIGRAQEDKYQLMFAEGPFAGDIEKDGNNINLTLSRYFIDKDYREIHEVYCKTAVPTTDFYNELCGATSRLITTVEQNQYDVEDINLLKEAYERLRSISV